MKRVLVTGGAGFIGRACLPLLVERGYEVHAVSRNENVPVPGVRWHHADLLAAGAGAAIISVVQPTHLLHLGWYAVPSKYWIAVENFTWVSASLNLFQSFAAQGGKRIVAAGSCAEYDWAYGWCSEGVTPTVPSTPYGVAKNALQNLLQSMSDQYDLSSAWGRIFFLYGPYEHPSRLVSSIISALLKGEPALCTIGTQMRDFLHVDDVAAGFCALLDSKTKGAINIASGDPVSVNEIACRIGDLLGRSELLRVGELPLAAQEPPLIVGDIRRLRNETGWVSRIGLDDGLTRTIAWWREKRERNVSN